MSRNASDIFCLKEVEAGKNDGTQMFSVNGACSLRLHRTNKQQQNHSFEYSGPKMTPRQEHISHQDDDQREVEYDVGDDYDVAEEGIQADGDKALRNMDEYGAKMSDDEDKMYEKGEPAKVYGLAETSSSMPRNPLTGVGMETKEGLHKQQKKTFNKMKPKWVW